MTSWICDTSKTHNWSGQGNIIEMPGHRQKRLWSSWFKTTATYKALKDKVKLGQNLDKHLHVIDAQYRLVCRAKISKFKAYRERAVASHSNIFKKLQACLVLQPLHALRTKLGFKKLRPKLASQQRYVLNDSQAHSPVLVLCQLLNCR